MKWKCPHKSVLQSGALMTVITEHFTVTTHNILDVIGVGDTTCDLELQSVSRRVVYRAEELIRSILFVSTAVLCPPPLLLCEDWEVTKY